MRWMLLPGLVSITFRKLSPGEVVKLAVQCGLRGIEWGGDIHVPHGDIAAAATTRRMCEDHELQIAAYGSYYRLGQPPSPPAHPSFHTVLDTAVALGAPVIRVWAGSAGSGKADEQTRSAITADAHRVVELAHRVGVTIALEFHGNTLTDSAESTVRLLREVDHPSLRTYWQPPNGVRFEDAIDGLHVVLPWLSHVHVFHWWPTAADRRPLAEGADRWRHYLSAAAPTDESDRFAMLEFVRGDDPENLPSDAEVLTNLLREANRR